MLQNRDAELMVIGMALNDIQTAEKAAALPDDAMSYDDTRAALQGLRGILEGHGTPDLITVTAACNGKLFQDIAPVLMKAMTMAVTTANYGQYETILMDLRKRRNLLAACNSAVAKMADPMEDPEALLAGVVKAADSSAEKPKSVTMKDAMVGLAKSLMEKKSGGINTGISGYDTLTGGMKPGQLIYLGARPGVGKTALALHIAVNVALRSGPVLVVTLEMPPEELAARVLAEASGLDVQKISNARLDEEELARAVEMAGETSVLPIRITDTARTPNQIRREAQSMLREGGLKLIVVDYIQLVYADNKTSSLYERVTSASQALKILALDLKVPVLALTQFNRAPESGNGRLKRRPTMADARDSGAIEQDANVFMTLYEPDEPDHGTDEYGRWRAGRDNGGVWQVLTVEKNRQGRTGQISLIFDKAHMRFTTLVVGSKEKEYE